MNVVLKILFLSLTNIKVNFQKSKIFYKTITPTKSILKIKEVKVIKKKEFTTVVLNSQKEIYFVYIAMLAYSNLQIYHFWLIKVWTLLFADFLIINFNKYAAFVNVLLLNFVAQLARLTKIKNYVIKSLNNQQS